MTDPTHLRERMVNDLAVDGELALAWRDAMLAVPRHVFIPDTIWRYQGNDLVPFRRSDNPGRWLKLAYGSGYVITQVDDGTPTGPGMTGRQVTSSAPQPGIIALMLAALDAQPGMTVCEIGTGTGYNAALLAAWLGAANITTIEVDDQVADQARRALATTGYPVLVVTGDGAQGYPPRAPYDRIIATVAAPRVPYPWIAQTRPGGRVLTPWATRYRSAGLLSLTVSDDGTATGALVNNTVSFMWLREQRIAPVRDVRQHVNSKTSAVVSHTDLHPYAVFGDDDASFAIAQRVAMCEVIYSPATDDSGQYTVWFIDPASRSWASIDYQPGADTFPVRQMGPRQLWDEVRDAHQWWVDVGSPTVDQWTFTVTPYGQHIELANRTAHLHLPTAQ